MRASSNKRVRADWTLALAPEFADLLGERCRWVEQCGGRWLGSRSEAIRLTSDKLRLAERFQQQGIPTPATQSWQWSNVSPPFPFVLKPRFGAGSQATYLCHNLADFVAAQAFQGDGWTGEMIAQPSCAGDAASVALLCGHGQAIALPAAAQQLSCDGRFRYEGGSLPLSPELNERAQRLARQAVGVVQGLFGYVGVDVVLGASNEDDRVIEINPRLTTSYVGLRRLARFNLAEALLMVTAGAALPRLDWHTEKIRFYADGRVE